MFAGHAVAGASLAFVLAFKLRRVLPRLAPASGERRFTGSYDAGSFTGNDFPETSWVSDHPRPRAGPVRRHRAAPDACRALNTRGEEVGSAGRGGIS